MILNDVGNLAINNLFDLSNRFKIVKIDYCNLMPNHLHSIIIINETQNVGVELALPKNAKEMDRASSVPTLGRIIQVFKSVSTIEINKYRQVSSVPVWQRN